MRKTLSPKTSLRVIIPLVRGTSAAMMLDQGSSIHHEGAREGHEERRTGLEKRPNINMFFSAFVLFVSFVVVYSG
jgi:hypothetical protein